MSDDSFLHGILGGDGQDEPEPEGHRLDVGDSLSESTASPIAGIVDNSGGAYPTEAWQVRYFDTGRYGELTARAVTVRVPAGLARACSPDVANQDGCIYAVRRWGFALRPSALELAGFDPTPLLSTGDDSDILRVIFQAASFELPGEFIIASPEHPFHLIDADGVLRASYVQWRTYLGALSYFVSGGRVNASFIRFWAESEASYRVAVELCLEALRDKE